MNYKEKLTLRDSISVTALTIFFLYQTFLSTLIPWWVLLLPTTILLTIVTIIFTALSVQCWISYFTDSLPRNSPTSLGGIRHNREEEDQ